MLTNSLLAVPVFERNLLSFGEQKPTSTFWTRDDGHVCVQSFRPDTDLFFHPHTYSEYTLVTCLEGEIAKTQMGQTQVIGPGETLIGNHGVEHTSGYWSRHGRLCQALIISVDRRVLAALTREFQLPEADGLTTPAFLSKVGSSILHDCARAIADEMHRGLPGHKIVVETLATRLLVEALRAWPRTQVEKIPANLLPRLPRRDFVRAYEFMRWCRKDSFRLHHLCQFLGSSEERLNRLFLASTRQTPASFYNRMLLERARDLLNDPQYSVKEIAFQLGFKTCSHFIAAFRKEFESTPQEYRKRGGATKLVLQFS